MSKLFDITKQQAELVNRAYFLDDTNEDDVLELEAINRSLIALSREADNVADWLGEMIHDAQFAELQATDLRKRAQRKEKVAINRLEFFKQLALNFMLDMGIRESRGTHFKISHSLTPGALQFEPSFNADDLPEEFVVTIPAIPEHKEADKAKLVASLRATIQTGTGKLNQTDAIATNPELPGVRLVRSESLTIK